MHQTLPLSVRCGECATLHAPDAGTVFLQRPVLTRRNSKHRTLKPASGAHRPVQNQNANLSAHESGGHRTRPVPHKVRPVTPRRAHKARAQGLRAAGFSLFFLRSRRAVPAPCPVSSSRRRRQRARSRHHWFPPGAQIRARDLFFLLLVLSSLTCQGLGFGSVSIPLHLMCLSFCLNGLEKGF